MEGNMKKKTVYWLVGIIVLVLVSLGIYFGASKPSGTGSEKTFTLEVNDGSNTTTETYTTDEANLGDYLTEAGIINGDEGEYGLYVKEVNGIKADYDTDGTYWKLQVNGEDSQVGVDSVEIEDGDIYSWILSK